MMFSRFARLAAIAALAVLPGPVFGDARVTAPDPQAMQAECVKHVITGPNTGMKQISFYDRDNQVIDTRTGVVSIPVLGCDATWLFVKLANGTRAKVKRIDVIIDGKCVPSLVSDAAAANHSTTGLGLC